METQVKTEVGVNNGIDLREAFKQTLTSIVKQYIGIDTELPPDYAVNDDDLDLFLKIQNENPSMSVFEVMEGCIRIDHVTKRFMSEGYCIFFLNHLCDGELNQITIRKPKAFLNHLCDGEP